MVNHSLDQPVRLTILCHSCPKHELSHTTELPARVPSWKLIWSQNQSHLLTEIKQLMKSPPLSLATDFSLFFKSCIRRS